MNPRSTLFRVATKVAPVMVAVLLLVAAKGFEFWFMPVVKDFHLTEISRLGGYIIMSGYMRKARDCQFVGVSAGGVTTDGKVGLPLKFMDADKEYDNSTRPTGMQDWGPWRIAIPATPHVLAVDLESVHSCHIAWPSTTRLARVPVVEGMVVDP